MGFKKVSQREGNQVNIFIHGYDTYTDYIEDAIKKLRLGGTTYLFKWNSWCPFNDIFSMKEHFVETVEEAERIGENFKNLVKKIYPRQQRPMLNLFGHSLGARIIHEALFHNEWKDVRLQNVVLLDGAADTDYWTTCSKKVGGKIFNCYSGIGEAFVLKMLAEFKNTDQIGHGPLRISNSKIRDIDCRELKHCDHWEELPYVLSNSLFDVPENRHLISQRECNCPYCEEHLTIDYQGGVSVEVCDTCDLEFKYDGFEAYPHSQQIECKCGYTHYSFRDINPPEPGDYFTCDTCGDYWIVAEEEA